MIQEEGRPSNTRRCELVERIEKWKHDSGFSVHDKVRIDRDDALGRSKMTDGPPGHGPPWEAPDEIAERSTVVLDEIEKQIAEGSVYAGIAPLFSGLAREVSAEQNQAEIQRETGNEESEIFCDAPGDGEVFDTEREAS